MDLYNHATIRQSGVNFRERKIGAYHWNFIMILALEAQQLNNDFWNRRTGNELESHNRTTPLRGKTRIPFQISCVRRCLRIGKCSSGILVRRVPSTRRFLEGLCTFPIFHCSSHRTMLRSGIHWYTIQCWIRQGWCFYHLRTPSPHCRRLGRWECRLQWGSCWGRRGL